MRFLVDTNVVSEVRKQRRCDPAVAAWWREVAEDDLCLSVLVLGEIRRGIELARPKDPAKAEVLASWLAELATGYGERVLAVDADVAEEWGRMRALGRAPIIDALLAATASVHGLTLVTRNEADVAGLGVAVFNPFTWNRGG